MATTEAAGLPLPGKQATTGCLLLPRLVIVVLALVLMTSCAAHKRTRSESIRITWAMADKERFAYVVVPSGNNSTEIAIVVAGKILERTLVDRPFPDLIQLARTSHNEIDRWADFKRLPETNQLRRLSVEYGATNHQSFSLVGSLDDMLLVFEESKALRELLLLSSRDQPKNYRILDEPGPHKAMGSDHHRSRQ